MICGSESWASGGWPARTSRRSSTSQARASRPSVRVGSTIPRRSKRSTASHSTPYTDYDAMLADPDIDVIDICTPHSLHAAQAIAAARAGKHLIIEKPIALTWKDAKKVRDAVRKARVQAMVGFEVRFSAQFMLIKSVVDQGLLGDLHYGEVDYYHGLGPWYGQFTWNVKKAFGGSSLLTAGCHALDSLLMLMDAPVEEVTSYSTRSRNKTFSPYEYRHDPGHHSEVQGRQGGEGRIAHRLPAAVLLPHAPGRQRGEPPRHEVLLAQAEGPRQVALEPAGHTPDRFGRREGPPLSAAVPGLRGRHQGRPEDAAHRFPHRARDTSRRLCRGSGRPNAAGR